MTREQLQKIADNHKAIVIICETFPDDSMHVVVRWSHPKDGTVLDAMILKNRENWSYANFNATNVDRVIKHAIKNRNSTHDILEGLK